jgi:LuxR family maltose regulon positive regulatory protein
MPLESRSLSTRLGRPRIAGDLVPRPRLLERLDEGQGRAFTIVSAPAGRGNSTLISSWLEACDCRSAWRSPDEDGDDLGQFLAYLPAASQTTFSGAVGEMLALLLAASPPPRFQP